MSTNGHNPKPYEIQIRKICDEMLAPCEETTSKQTAHALREFAHKIRSVFSS